MLCWFLLSHKHIENLSDQNYALIIRKTLSWLNDEMGSTDIGYGSSMSADANGKEGDYYLWKKDANG